MLLTNMFLTAINLTDSVWPSTDLGRFTGGFGHFGCMLESIALPSRDESIIMTCPMPSAGFIVRSCCLSTLDDIDWFLGESNESVNSRLTDQRCNRLRYFHRYLPYLGIYVLEFRRSADWRSARGSEMEEWRALHRLGPSGTRTPRASDYPQGNPHHTTK